MSGCGCGANVLGLREETARRSATERSW